MYGPGMVTGVDRRAVQGVDRDDGRQRGVDSAAQPEYDVSEAVLANVVARSEDEGAVDLFLFDGVGRDRAWRDRRAARRRKIPQVDPLDP